MVIVCVKIIVSMRFNHQSLLYVFSAYVPELKYDLYLYIFGVLIPRPSSATVLLRPGFALFGQLVAKAPGFQEVAQAVRSHWRSGQSWKLMVQQAGKDAKSSRSLFLEVVCF